MSAGELAWRVACKLRGAIDARMLPSRALPLDAGSIAHSLDPAELFQPAAVSPILCGGSSGGEIAGGTGAALGMARSWCSGSRDAGYRDEWRQALVTQADQAMQHRVALFDLDDVYLGDPINWNFEPKAQRPTSTGPAAGIDYRDYAVTGDCKWVWEPNRHQHLVVLGRAARVTGDRRYAEEVVSQIDSWITQCPYGYGMNWRSPLELAIRLINWCWAIELVRPFGVVTGEFVGRLVPAVYRHLWDIQRHYSRYSSANNHLIGEAAGVFIGASYFAGLRDASKWRSRAAEILRREISAQTFPDGGTREQATSYHLFVTEFFLLTGICARSTDSDLGAGYWQRLERMLDFTHSLCEGGPLPMFGDADDGYVLDLGGRANAVHSLLSTGAVLFSRPEFKALAGSPAEATWWLTGEAGCDGFDRLPPAAGRQLESKALPDAGYYLLQCGARGKDSAISAIVDCGPLGMEPIFAHGHADALSLVLRVGGRDVLIDPGTFDYFTYADWRDYFRSTRAHNTATVADADQSLNLGKFLWSRPAAALCRSWRATEQGSEFVGEHHGYARLRDPVVHRRTVALSGRDAELVVTDRFEADDRHDVALHWHVAEGCSVEVLGDSLVVIDFGCGRLRMELPQKLAVSAVFGREAPPLGWVSRGYHRKSASWTLVASGKIDGTTAFATRMRVLPVPSISGRTLRRTADAGAARKN